MGQIEIKITLSTEEINRWVKQIGDSMPSMSPDLLSRATEFIQNMVKNGVVTPPIIDFDGKR